MRKKVAVENIQVLLFSFFSPTRAQKFFPQQGLKNFWKILLEDISKLFYSIV
jgi:hypothetical protein